MGKGGAGLGDCAQGHLGPHGCQAGQAWGTGSSQCGKQPAGPGEGRLFAPPAAAPEPEERLSRDRRSPRARATAVLLLLPKKEARTLDFYMKSPDFKCRLVAILSKRVLQDG